MEAPELMTPSAEEERVRLLLLCGGICRDRCRETVCFSVFETDTRARGVFLLVRLCRYVGGSIQSSLAKECTPSVCHGRSWMRASFS